MIHVFLHHCAQEKAEHGYSKAVADLSQRESQLEASADKLYQVIIQQLLGILLHYYFQPSARVGIMSTGNRTSNPGTVTYAFSQLCRIDDSHCCFDR